VEKQLLQQTKNPPGGWLFMYTANTNVNFNSIVTGTPPHLNA
jgi:hypothetical protein